MAGNAPQSVAETVRALAPAWNALAVEAACAVWAIHRRSLAVSGLGEGVRALAGEIMAMLPIDEEGVAIFDLAPVVDVLQGAFGAGF